ncbi:MAG TPA: hypothetical protein VI299_13945 [Polyangiales bacterium]
MRFDPVIHLPTAWISAAGEFVLYLFEGQLSLADMDRIQAHASNWLLDHPGRRVDMAVVFPSGASMSAVERQRMVALIKLGEAERAASATVFLAEGLLASVQRSILTGIMLLAPPPHPVKIFAHIPEAAHWLYPHLRRLTGPRLTLDVFVRAVDAHIAAFHARRERGLMAV